ncbi:MAG: protein kinase [Candidatus Eisenbacteria bacterium]
MDHSAHDSPGSEPARGHRSREGKEIPAAIGRYPVTGVLGRGGMGIVYAGEDPQLGRAIAIKVLHPRIAVDSAGRTSFEREARLLAALNHPNIATIYSLERQDERDFLTMELVSGDSLADRIARGPVSPSQSIEFARQIASGLEAAHAAGILHLDLKPTNIKITQDERVKLVDFGLARIRSSQEAASSERAAIAQPATIEMEIQGSPGYMSPEQLRGGPFDTKSDIWALGCVLFEMFAGRPAFPGPTVSDRIAATLQTVPDWVALPTDTPLRIRFLIQQCLERDVDRRLDSMTRARRMLEGEIASAMQEPIPEPTSPEAGQHPTNLPLALTSFIGRSVLLEELARRLAEERLVTLTGPGGCGKTRLAREAGRRLLPAFPDGVWLVELGPVREPEMVPHAACAALGIREDSQRPLTETLRLELKSRQMLVILDNCEHLVDASARLAQYLLEVCPNLRVLATSRERLGVAGESLCPLPPLAIPGSMEFRSVSDLEQIESVRLFLDRAQAADARFTLTPDNAELVAQVCTRLDGIPLALELAAARVGVLPVEEIAQRLDDRFHLLTTSTRTSIPHHRTLHALIDWSHDTLTDAESLLFRRLGIFSGGWSLEAVEEICAPGDIEPWNVLDLHSRLVERSLIERDVDGERRAGQVRYRALETIREYAREKLREALEEEMLQLRHRGFFLALAVGSSAHLVGPDQRVWSQRLEVDHDNLRSAIAGACAPGPQRDVEAAVKIAASLGRYWYGRGRWTEGRTLMKEVLALPGAATRNACRAQALAWTGWIALWQGDLDEAWTTNQESLAIRRELGDRMGISQSLNNLGAVALERADFAACRAFYEESLALRRAEGNLRYQAVSLHNLAELCFRTGDLEEARRFNEESLALRREVGDLMGIADSLCALGMVAERMSDLAGAREFHEASLANRMDREDPMGIGESLHNLAGIDAQEGRFDTARLRYARSLSIRKGLGDRLGIIESLEAIGFLEIEAGDYRRAACVLGAAAAVRAEIEAAVPPPRERQLEKALGRARRQLGHSAVESEWERGRRMTIPEAVECAASGLPGT